MPEEFIEALHLNQAAFGIRLNDVQTTRLAEYYELVLRHNPLLHLVAPCSQREFAIRHILESLTLLEHLPHSAKFADVGPGAGLPSVPCLLVRDDLSATLIESKEKKARFLGLAVRELGLSDRALIVNKQFEEASPGDADHVTCRALDKFTEKVPRLIRWARGRRLLLFGGPTLAHALEQANAVSERSLLPLAERRFLFQCSLEPRPRKNGS